ncbi:MAG: isocitrate lyase/phosphoenolpyruvate mutase family protein [Alphaproteobacteria bacterium]|nr:isocitrate lyase/phosphoenolpyruvate mutase family protein [Alphaproteobacteria bacterium]
MPVSQKDKAERFQALHRGPGIFVIPNPWDIGSARILASMGFKALATTSAGMAFAMGRRDGAVTRDEALAHARDIAGASDLPVSADLENCFGDAPDVVAETIRLAAGAGLVGCSVEDTTNDPSKPIYDFDLAVARVAAAVKAARSLPIPFTLTARAENFLHGRSDLDDTIRRLKAFEAAGADVLYAPGLPSVDVLKQVLAAVKKPVNVLMGSKALPLTVEQLGAMGARRISVGGALYRAAMGEFLRAAREIKDKGSFTYTDRAATHAELTGFMAARPR